MISTHDTLRLGAHMPIAGGLPLAFDRLKIIQGTAMQIFTKNQRQWFTKPLTDQEVADFLAAWGEWPGLPIAAHGSYLVNLATNKDDAVSQMINAFANEIQRTEQLQIPYLIIHPGSHLGDGVEPGLKRVADTLDRAIQKAMEASNTTVLLETTAGQGTSLGATFEELATIIERSKYSDRLGVCLDTSHVFAAGYDIKTEKAYNKTIEELDRVVGLDRLQFIHLNDSKKDLGSRVDRHEHIGKGRIGKEAFSFLLNDPRLNHIPMVLETPKDKDLADDIKNLKVLRSLIKG